MQKGEKYKISSLPGQAPETAYVICKAITNFDFEDRLS